MKKRLMIFGLSVVTILLAAVYSIAQDNETESIGVYGTCKGTSINLCIFKCSGCDTLFAPEDGSDPKGTEGKLTRGICPVCAYDFSTPAESEN